MIQGSGTTNPPPATYPYNEPTNLTIEQNPSEDWAFSHWLLDYVTQQETGPITITVDENHTLLAVFVEKLPACKITFKTTDSQGQDIEGVTIRSTTQPAKQRSIFSYTNATGEAVTGLIYDGYYVFNLSRHGYDPVTEEVGLDPGERLEAVVVLEESGVELVLTVQDQVGVLLGNVTVASVVEPAGQDPVEGVTDQGGVVVFGGVKPGGYSFRLSGLWVREEVRPVSVRLGEVSQSYRVMVQRLCGLGLSVVDEQGKGIEGVRIESLVAPLGQVALAGVCDGELLFDGLVPGSYTIRFSKEGYAPIDRSVTLGAGSLNVPGQIVLVKPLLIIVSENLLLILALEAAVGVCAYFVLTKILSRPIRVR